VIAALWLLERRDGKESAKLKTLSSFVVAFLRIRHDFSIECRLLMDILSFFTKK
jgi:hypothetical protein